MLQDTIHDVPVLRRPFPPKEWLFGAALAETPIEVCVEKGC